jgi:hypothetical protein
LRQRTGYPERAADRRADTRRGQRSSAARGYGCTDHASYTSSITDASAADD